MYCTPIENQSFPGYFEIPGFCRYVINKFGLVLNKKTSLALDGGTHSDGYFNYGLLDDDNIKRTCGRHRLMAMVFKDPGYDVSELVVNHEDGIKGNDFLDNLEWMTHQKNIEHAGRLGITGKCLPIQVRCVDTGRVVEFPSIVECSRHFEMSRDAANYRVRVGEARVFPERRQYRYARGNDVWYIPENIDNELLLNGLSKRILVKNVLTGTVREFEKLSDFAAEMKISPATVTFWMSRKGQPVFPRYVQLKWVDDPTPWREIGQPELELSKTMNTKPVVSIFDRTGDVTIYSSAVECARENGVKPTALDHRLKSNGAKVYSDGCRYMYYKSDFIHPQSHWSGMIRWNSS